MEIVINNKLKGVKMENEFRQGEEGFEKDQDTAHEMANAEVPIRDIVEDLKKQGVSPDKLKTRFESGSLVDVAETAKAIFEEARGLADDAMIASRKQPKIPQLLTADVSIPIDVISKTREILRQRIGGDSRYTISFDGKRDLLTFNG